MFEAHQNLIGSRHTSLRDDLSSVG